MRSFGIPTWWRVACTRRKLLNTIPPATHALAALVPLLWWSSLRGQYSPLLIVGAIVVGNLPDVDCAYSRIGRALYPIAKWIETRFGHRTVTHSLLAVAAVAALSFAICRFAGSPFWYWWPTFYASHLLLDMLVGGGTAVPLLWPLKYRFWFGIDVKAGSSGERVVFSLLLVGAIIPLLIHPTALDPARLLRRATGSVDMALYDTRQWEATHDVELEIEGTWQTGDARRPISGRFPVHHVTGSTFHLRDPEDGAAFTAGRFGDVDVYLTRAVAHQGRRRQAMALSTPTPGPSPTPQLLAVQVDGITDPGAQILVHPGDHVRPGVTLALPPTLPPPPTATPWTPDPLALAQAQAEWDVAQAQYRVSTSWVPVDEITVLYAQAQVLQVQAQITDLEIRIAEGKVPDTGALAALEARLAAAEAQLAQLEESGGRGPTWAERRLAEAQLSRAHLVYSATVATPTPAPTPAPVAPRTIDALVAGQVQSVYVSRVDPQDNTATVAIVIAVSPLSHAATGAGGEGAIATVDRVVDGDTLDVSWPSGATARVRLIGVDAPETVDPSQPVACYGPEASGYTGSLLPEGAQVSLEFDRQRLDGYGRTLAYVYLLGGSHDGHMLQALLLENGYARVLIVAPNDAHAALFYSLEDQARAEERGLWGACPE
jgi:endonuclease YncB( thermonuclease family)/membrane-bound metal-dependent hydrolase YbcI (DUF457 family)